MKTIELNNDTMKSKLIDLGLYVRKISDHAYSCRTQNDHLLVVDYGYDELIEEDVWHLDVYNSRTCNCTKTEDEMIDILKSYLKIR